MGFIVAYGLEFRLQPLYGLEGEHVSSLPGRDLNFVFYPCGITFVSSFALKDSWFSRCWWIL